jgi:hypothetical protein
MIAVVGLSAAVVILAVNDGGAAVSGSSAPSLVAPAQAPAVPSFDRNRPDEGTRGPFAAPSASAPRFDNGRPDEGTRGPGH